MKNNYGSKLYRTVAALLPVASDRQGGCLRCGACCRLPNRCPFLRAGADGCSFCAIWRLRPLNCRKYLRSSIEWLTPARCGYQFEKETGRQSAWLHGWPAILKRVREVWTSSIISSPR